MNTKKRKKNDETKPKEKTVKTEFRLSASEALSVFLSGDFNQWSTTSHPLRKGKNGDWKISLNLPPGTYQYRYIVDGQWRDDPGSSECVGNPYGTTNCMRVVG